MTISKLKAGGCAISIIAGLAFANVASAAAVPTTPATQMLFNINLPSTIGATEHRTAASNSISASIRHSPRKIFGSLRIA